MTNSEIAHSIFTVALFSLVFRAAGDPLAFTVSSFAAGLFMIFLTDRFVRRHASR